MRRTPIDHGIFRHEPAGNAAPGDEGVDWAEVARLTLEKASDLGFIRAGVASLEPFDEPVARLTAFISAGRHGSMQYLMHRQTNGAFTRSDAQYLLPGAQSAVVVALPYPAPDRDETRGDAESGVARYARGDDYHIVLKEKLLLLADTVAQLAGQAVTARPCVDSAPLFERDLAVRAGFAFLGKNTLAIAPGAGSHFLLGELLLDVPLPPSPGRTPQGCGSCRACLDACPTGAFVRPFELDAKKCISYLTIESPSDVPLGLRSAVGTHLFGCDICQAVCPFNAAGEKRESAKELKARPLVEDLTAVAALTLGSSAYKKLVRGSALRRASRNQLARNAAVALGNLGREQDVALLATQALEHPSEQVRRHCVWALGNLFHRHGIVGAKAVLESLCASESHAIAAQARETIDLDSFEKSSGSHAAADAHGNESVPPLNSV